MKITDFIASIPSLSMTHTPIPVRPDGYEEPKNTREKPFHYVFTLIFCGRIFQSFYTNGSGHVGIRRQGKWIPRYTMSAATRRHYENSFAFSFQPIPPELSEVLDSLRSDCSAVDSAPTWPEFAAEFGYDVDSIKAKGVYEACVNIREQMRKLLREHYTTFINCEPE